MRALVVIPTYNEAGSIEEVVGRGLAADPRVDVLVGDDSSPDGTAKLVGEVASGESREDLLVRVALGLPIHDCTAGYRAYRREVLEALPVEAVQSNGYCFQVEMAHRAWREGFRVIEVPITFTERTAGVSKMSQRIVLEALLRVAVLGLTAGRGGGPRP